MRKNYIDETGNIYGKLKVLNLPPISDNGIKWICQCECGNIKTIYGGHLRAGSTFTCGHCGWDTDEERFWSKVEKNSDNECWEWKAGKYSFGYGEFSINGKNDLAHRYSYSLYYGEIPKGMFVCHHCDNPPCVNPKHLFLGTHIDNVNDMLQKKRNPRGEKSGNAKLTWKKVRKMRKMYEADNYKQCELADIFGIKQPQVSSIIRNEAWKE